MDRKKIKFKAKKVFKKHVLLLILVCLVATFIGNETRDTLMLYRLEDTSMNNKVISEIKKHSVDKVDKKVKEANEKLKKAEPGLFERKEGVLSNLVNSVSTGSIYVGMYRSINNIIKSKNITLSIIIFINFCLYFLIWFFIINTYTVVSRRIFLESRIYKKVSYDRFIYLFRVKRLFKTAKTMFLKLIFLTLWSFTIIGGIIKRYSYFLVPYIVAENPDINSLDAITLSRKMMKNHKWECFKLELSFIGWNLLGILTFNLSRIFYSNPYIVATYTEYYVYLRSEAKKNKIPLSEKLNDKYLYKKATIKELKKEYEDIDSFTNEYVVIQKKTGIRGFLYENLGINTYGDKAEKKYEKEYLKKLKVKEYKRVYKGKIYPTRLFSIKSKERKRRIEMLNYLKHYNITTLIILFFLFSFIGWVWEVFLHIVVSGTFVNRGTFHGPWLPIYGFGGILILTVLYKFRCKPVKEFLSTIILCGTVEYFTALFLELTHDGQKWWDYSGYFLNLHGRICAEGLLVFALGGFAVVYLLAPLIDNKIKEKNSKILVPICILLVFLFTIDNVYSFRHPNTGDGITSYNKTTYNNVIDKNKKTTIL